MYIKRLLYYCGIAVCTAGMIVCVTLLVRQYMSYRTSAEAYALLSQKAITKPSTQSALEFEENIEQAIPTVDFQALRAINQDIVGWLYCADTAISYPVVQSMDNEYYLNHLFDGTQNGAGCLFIDSQWDRTDDRNCVIYGHHMKDGTMFASLEQYQSQEYFTAHPSFLWLTEDGIWVMDLFAAYFTKPESDAWRMSFASDQDFEDWLQRIQERSCILGTAKPEADDQIMTLSTCSYIEEDTRFVCHGVMHLLEK